MTNTLTASREEVSGRSGNERPPWILEGDGKAGRVAKMRQGKGKNREAVHCGLELNEIDAFNFKTCLNVFPMSSGANE